MKEIRNTFPFYKTRNLTNEIISKDYYRKGFKNKISQTSSALTHLVALLAGF